MQNVDPIHMRSSHTIPPTCGSTKRATWAGALTVALAALVCMPAVATAKGKTPCGASTQEMFGACQASARADRLVALAGCDNLPDRMARRTCRAATNGALSDAMDGCNRQRMARRGVCATLGGAAYAPAFDPARFVAVIDNPYFPLTPGTTYVYEGQTANGLEHDEFVITHETKTILGIACVQVRDTGTVDGALVEDTFDWFAQDRDGNVWYMGENAKQLDGELTSGVEGSWIGGVDGAQPGIVMEAQPAIGDFYRQEFSLGVAEDMAAVTSVSESVTVPAGAFTSCLETTETSPLEPDAREHKFYARGVGNVLTVDLETGETLPLVRIVAE